MKWQPPRTAWGAELRRILGDGEWHDRAEVTETVGKIVPPGQAYRSAEAHRYRTARIAPAPRIRGDEYRAVKVGKNRIVNGFIGRQIRFGSIEKKGTDIRATEEALRMWRTGKKSR